MVWGLEMRPASVESLQLYAKERGLSLHVSAIITGSPIIKNSEIWPEPSDIDLVATQRETPKLLGEETGGLLAEMARDIAHVVKFPVNTAYLHALGVAASAMTKSFKYQYRGKPKPITLYVCTAQPPSSGKSGVNDMLLDPIRDAYIEINKKNRKRRREIELEIKELERSLSKTDIHDSALKSKSDQLDQAYQELDNTPIWQPTIKDATIEAAESTAKRQTGMINIVSDEAEAINTIFGNTYTKEGAKSNFGLLLSAWDGDIVETVRVGREAFIGRARGSISVLAQDDSVESILRAGATGRGLAERFLLLAEKSLLGYRDHTQFRAPNPDILQRYEEAMYNIVNESDVVLNVCNESMLFINTYRNMIEEEMRDCGKYEHNLITGFMGKLDKQVLKIASVLHVIDQWQTGGKRSKDLSEDRVMEACALFSQLAKTYINAADSMGYVGEGSEVVVLSETLAKKANKGELVLTIRKLTSDIKNKKPFSGMRNLTRKLTEKMLPKLEENNYCSVSGKTVYINPRLK